MRRITLVADAWAKAGRAFLNAQPCEVASTCALAKACQTLPWDTEFRIQAVRPVRHVGCAVHAGGVRVVEVEPVPLETSLPVSKTRGSAARWSPPTCRHRGCPHWDRCFAHGLVPQSEYEVAKVGGRLECAMGHDLVAVTLRPGKATAGG